MEYRDRILNGRFRRQTLYGLHDNTLGFLVRIELCFLYNLGFVARRLVLRSLCHSLYQLLLSGFCRHTRNLLDTTDVLRLELLGFAA